MFPTQLHADLIASSARALKTLNGILDNSEKDAQRVSAALGILRLTERVFNKLPVPDGSEGKGEGPASASQLPRADCPSTTTRPLTSSPPPLTTSSSPLSRSRPLEPDELAELNTHYTLQHSRLHDPTMAAFWRDKLEDAREFNRLTHPARHRAAAAQPSVPP